MSKKITEKVSNNNYQVEFNSLTQEPSLEYELATETLNFIAADDPSENALAALSNKLRASTDSFKVVVTNKGPDKVKPVVRVAETTETVVDVATVDTNTSTSNVLAPKRLQSTEAVKLGFVAALKTEEDKAKGAFKAFVIFNVEEGYFIYFVTINDPDGLGEFMKVEPALILPNSTSDITLNSEKFEHFKSNKDTGPYEHLKSGKMDLYADLRGIRTVENKALFLERIAAEIESGDDIARKVFDVIEDTKTINLKLLSILVVENKNKKST